jgi:putative aminopeptidase FrvX
MTESLELLKNLIGVPGLTGHEKPIRKFLEEAWEPLIDELNVSKLGSLHGLCKGSAEGPVKL